MLFKPLDDKQLASSTPKETALLSQPQEAQAAAICPPRCKECPPKPKNVTKPMVVVAELQGMQVCLPRLEFEPLPP